MDRNGLTRFQKIATSAAAVFAIAGGLGTALGLAIAALGDLEHAVQNLEKQKIALCQHTKSQRILENQLNQARIFAQILDTKVRIMRIRLDVEQDRMPSGETEESARDHAERLADQEDDWRQKLDELQKASLDPQEDREC